MVSWNSYTDPIYIYNAYTIAEESEALICVCILTRIFPLILDTAKSWTWLHPSGLIPLYQETQSRFTDAMNASESSLHPGAFLWMLYLNFLFLLWKVFKGRAEQEVQTPIWEQTDADSISKPKAKRSLTSEESTL